MGRWWTASLRADPGLPASQSGALPYLLVSDEPTVHWVHLPNEANGGWEHQMAKKTEHNVLTQEPVEEEKKVAKDLSQELAASLERLPGDIVKCTRVGTDRYRCNWMAPEVNPKYDNPGMSGLA